MSATTRAESFSYAAPAQSSSRWAPVLAGLPHLCMGIILSIDLFVRSFIPGHKTLPFFRSSNILVLPFLAASLVILVYARRHHAPLWTAAWDGYAILLSVAAVTLLLAAIDEESAVYQAGLTVLALLALLIGYFLRFRYAPRHALLMGMLLLPFGALVFLDTVPLFTQAVFVLALYLLYGLLSAWVVIAPGWTAAAAVTWIASLLAYIVQGLVFVTYSAAPASQSVLQSEAKSMFLIQSGLTSAFCFVPWLLWKIRDLLVREAP